MTTELPGIVAEHIAAVNAFDTDAIVATFAPDAYVNDNRREIWGTDAIRAFMDKEIVGDHVTMESARSSTTTATRSSGPRYDGTYDKTNLPDELVMTNYFSVRDGKIVSLDRHLQPAVPVLSGRPVLSGGLRRPPAAGGWPAPLRRQACRGRARARSGRRAPPTAAGSWSRPGRGRR